VITLDYKRESHPDLPWLQIPERDFAPFTCSSLQYGSGKVAVAYCDLKTIPAYISGGWLHGWVPDYQLVDKRLALEQSVQDPSKEYSWVATRAHEKYLQEQGCLSQAIGLSYCYLPERIYLRRKSSLLVMPAHSLEYTKHSWKFEEYADAIDEIRGRFETVAICIYPACIKNGYWVESFKKRGYPIIEGANALDRNSLERVRALMSQFEYVTTNAFGSCIAYAAALGAKVSVYGPLAEIKQEDIVADPYWLARPGLVDRGLDVLSAKFLASEIPELFVAPEKAIARTEWGRQQIGFENKVSPAEMRKLFGWDFAGRAKRRAQILVQQTKAAGNLKTAKAALKKILKPEDAKIEREMERLAKWPAGKSGTAILQGREIYFHEAAGFLREYDRVFWQKYYDFPSVLGNPLIIDFKPGCGVSLRFWAEKFPAPRILIAQFEPEAHEALRKNIAVAGNAEVVFCDKAIPVTREIPDPGESVDFLNLPDWTGEQPCSEFFPEWLRRVEQLHFSCKHHPRTGPSLGKALHYLEEQGFEAFFQNSSSAKRPMFQWVENSPQKLIIDVWVKKAG
jgi:hypothetical protein